MDRKARIDSRYPFDWREMIRNQDADPGQTIESHIVQLIQAVGPWRLKYGKPWRITSGYRTPEHNRLVGGVRNSTHTRGMAMDIDRGAFNTTQVRDLWTNWPGGMGLYGTFIHLDTRSTKPRWRVVPLP